MMDNSTSTINYQLSIINYQLSIINYLNGIWNHKKDRQESKVLLKV